MSRTTPAPGFARLGAVGRKAARHHAQRQRHQQRELAEMLPEQGPPVSLEAFASAAMAEIEKRDGCELELVAALKACRAPIAAWSPL